MTDLIQEIEKAIEKRCRDFYNPNTFYDGAHFILPLLKKALENHAAKQVYLRECKIYGVFPNDKKIAEIEKQISDEMLKLLGENHE